MKRSVTGRAVVPYAISRSYSSPVPYNVLITRSFLGLGDGEEILKRDKRVKVVYQWPHLHSPIPRPTLLHQIRLNSPIHAILCLLTDSIDQEILEACGSSLKVVSSMSVGVDHIDLHACKLRNVKVGYTPGVLTSATADLGVGLTLMSVRRLNEGVDKVRNGEWGTWSPSWMCSPLDLSSSTLAIVGLGRIGLAYATRMKAFGCNILYTGSKPKPHIPPEFARYEESLEEMLQESDIVSIHCELNKDTKHLFSSKQFNVMKQHAILINTSRGGVVDQEALVKALREKRIGGAGLDVTTPEPLPTSHPLLSFPNVCVLPHLGSATIPTRTKMAKMAVENLLCGISSKPLVNEFFSS